MKGVNADTPTRWSFAEHCWGRRKKRKGKKIRVCLIMKGRWGTGGRGPRMVPPGPAFVQVSPLIVRTVWWRGLLTSCDLTAAMCRVI